MCKRFVLLGALLALMITTGCSLPTQFNDSRMDIYKKIHHTYSRMTSYTAEVRVTVKGNKTENTYLLTHEVKEPNVSAITIKEPSHLAGLKTVICGDKVLISAKNVGQELLTETSPMNDVLLVNEFFSLYYRSEETAIHASTEEDSKTLLLETECSPQTSGAYKATMLLDTKTLHPKTITVFDAGGNVRRMAEFLSFTYNPSLSEDIFTIE